MSETSEKSPSQFPKAWGDVFQGLVWSHNQPKTQIYSVYYPMSVYSLEVGAIGYAWLYSTFKQSRIRSRSCKLEKYRWQIERSLQDFVSIAYVLTVFPCSNSLETARGNSWSIIEDRIYSAKKFSCPIYRMNSLSRTKSTLSKSKNPVFPSSFSNTSKCAWNRFMETVDSMCGSSALRSGITNGQTVSLSQSSQATAPVSVQHSESLQISHIRSVIIDSSQNKHIQSLHLHAHEEPG